MPLLGPHNTTHNEPLAPVEGVAVDTVVEEVEDRDLLLAARGGDRVAFAALVTKHQGAVFGYLRSRVLDWSDVEDLCQEVFLRSYVGREKFDGTFAARPWLIGIARNLLREHVRKIRRRKEVAWTELCLELEDLMPDRNLGTEVDDPFEAVMKQLPHCMTQLGQSAQQALDLHYQSRHKLAEIATRLKRSEGAVKLLLFRARQALKRCLDRVTGGEPA